MIIFVRFSLVFVSIKKIYQTLNTVFHHIPKQHELCQRYSAARRVFKRVIQWYSRDA